MNTVEIVLSTAIGVVVLSQIIMTIRLFRTSSLTGEQKRYQIFLVWLLPLLGCGIIWITNRSLDADASTPTADRNFVPDDRGNIAGPIAGDSQH